MDERRYRIEVTGVTPLLMHADDVVWADQVKEKRDRIKKEDKGNFTAGDDRCPPETWKGYLYSDGERVAIPTDVVRGCWVRAGMKKTLKGKETFKSLVAAAVVFDDLFWEFTCRGRPVAMEPIMAIGGSFLEHYKAAEALGFRLHVKRAPVARGGAKHVRVRPLFEEWAASGTITVIDKQITLEVLRELAGIGGLRLGWCDWRPGAGSPGPYGKHEVVIKAA